MRVNITGKGWRFVSPYIWEFFEIRHPPLKEAMGLAYRANADFFAATYSYCLKQRKTGETFPCHIDPRNGSVLMTGIVTYE